MMLAVGVASSSLVPVPGPLALATGLLLALAGPHAWAIAPASAPGEVAAPTADPPPPEAPPVVALPEQLRVKVAPAIDDASLIPGWVAERNARIAEQVPTREGQEQWIEVEISGDTYDYHVLVKAMRDGAAVEPVAELVTCECNNEKLLELVDERIARAIEQLQAPSETPSKVPPDGEPDPLSGSTSTPERERRTISVLGIGGIATAAVGVGALAGGTVMVLIPPQPVRDRFSLARNYDVPGIAALAMGGTVLAAGVTMLVVDVIQCRKPNAPPRCYRDRKEAKAPRLEVGPSLEANRGGITVWGRF